MLIHNATFMMECRREAEFIEWFKENLPALGSLSNPRLSCMREAGGIDYRHAEAQSVAFQTEFSDIEQAHAWSESKFASLAANFEEKFGPQAMVFVSIFEAMDMNK